MALLPTEFTVKEHPSELPKYWEGGSQHFKQVYNSFELGHIRRYLGMCGLCTVSHVHLAECYAHLYTSSDLSH